MGSVIWSKHEGWNSVTQQKAGENTRDTAEIET